MIDGLSTGIVVLSLALTGWGILTMSRRIPPGRAQVVGAGVLEVVLLVQVVIAAVLLIGGERPADTATVVGYLAGIVLLMPIAVAWALSERTRYSGLVLAVAAFSVLAMTLRLDMLWEAPRG